MQVATPETVLGDFDDDAFTHHGVISRFFRRGDRFFVNTEGPDGTPADFELTHILGVEPLQQYLAPFPGGRLQSLPIAWDTGRNAVVPPLSRRAHRARRPPALDGPLPDLEPAVRGLPLDGPAKGL